MVLEPEHSIHRFIRADGPLAFATVPAEGSFWHELLSLCVRHHQKSSTKRSRALRVQGHQCRNLDRQAVGLSRNVRGNIWRCILRHYEIEALARLAGRVSVAITLEW